MSGTLDDPRDLAGQLLAMRRLVEGVARRGSVPYIGVGRNSSQSIPSTVLGAWTPFEFDRVDTEDRYGMFDPATPTEITLPKSGIWALVGQVGWDSASGAGARGVMLGGVFDVRNAVVGFTTGISVVNIVPGVVAGQAIELRGSQNSGIALNAAPAFLAVFLSGA